jgi:hypothetical protein
MYTYRVVGLETPQGFYGQELRRKQDWFSEFQSEKNRGTERGPLTCNRARSLPITCSEVKKKLSNRLTFFRSEISFARSTLL